ncbi:MAG: 3'-5' exonuclease, partial [Ignavibacteria bacterium]|nr:3'-5' exonuclease [Ignavibacteria bacterium]
MEKKETEYDVNYLNLTCAKNVNFILENPDLTVFPISRKPAGSVSFLVSIAEPKKETDETGEESMNEAQLLAKFIRKSVDSDNPLLAFDEGTGLRKISYRDIAVLSRKKATLSTLAREFLAEGIPFVIHSGSGYFESQEILDIISYLNFLTNPGDDLAVSGLLKSGFFNLSDNELLTLAKYCKNSSLWVNLENWCQVNKEISDKTTNLMKRAFNLLNELKLYSGFLTVSQNILRLLEATGWYGTISKEPARRQIEANIDKMMQLARDYESRGFRSMHDFVEHLNYILDASVNESEAVHLSDKNAVNIMTIHASKGLEFPLVVLYNTNSKSGKNESFTISKEFG